VAVVVRDGDPRSAVALAVVTANADASAALAAIVESRVRKSGFPATDSRVDRDGFRIRALVDAADRIAPLAAAFRAAIGTTVTATMPELAAASQKVAALHRHPFESAAADAVSRCTGEAGVAAGAPDPVSAGGALQIEAWRRSAYSTGRVAFGVVGPAWAGDRLARAVEAMENWPAGPAWDDPWPIEDAVGVHASAERAAGTARLTIATRVGDPDDAVGAAASMGRPSSPIALRLSGLPLPFRLVEVGATARPRGGCLSVTIETRRPYQGPAGIEDASAVAAAIASREIEQELLDARSDRAPDRADSAIGQGGWRAVHGASDPRDAAGLAAFWTLVGRTAKPGDARQNSSVALSIAAAKGEPRAEDRDLAATRSFSAAYKRADRMLRTPVLEHREKIERGQRELWLLLASPCGTGAESDADGGTAALALTAAIAARRTDDDGVALEPLIGPDAVGIVAHAPPAPAESARAHAGRVARAAARAFASVHLATGPFADARAALLARLGDGASPDGRALVAVAGLIAPSHPSWIAPLGSWDAIAQSSTEAASLKWHSIATGPMRLATIANSDLSQSEVAAREVDRWLVRRGDGPRACPAVDAGRPPKSGTLQVSLGAAAAASQAIVALPAPSPASQDRPAAELLLAGLSGSDGWLARAMGPLGSGASAQPRLLGGARSSALLIDVRASEATLENAVAQVRGVLSRIRLGALTAADLDRSVYVRQRWDLEAAMDPRHRLLDLWQNRTPAAPAPTLDAWRAWSAVALGEDRLVVVIARPKR
jgi:hypothetical protein